MIGAIKISQLSSWTGISTIDTMYLPSKGASAGFLSDKFGRPSRTSYACLYYVHFHKSHLTNLHETPRPASLECTPSSLVPHILIAAKNRDAEQLYGYTKTSMFVTPIAYVGHCSESRQCMRAKVRARRLSYNQRLI